MTAFSELDEVRAKSNLSNELELSGINLLSDVHKTDIFSLEGRRLTSVGLAQARPNYTCMSIHAFHTNISTYM